MHKARIGSVDIAKGIAILSIVIGHIGIYSSQGVELTQPWVFQFHVPVFFVIAGYFLSDKLSIKDFIIQKARRLLLPYAAICLVIIAGVALIGACNGGNTWPATFAQTKDAVLAALYGCGSWYTPTPFDIAPIGAIWFLPALFFALIIGRVCLQIKHGWLITVPLAIAALATARILWLPLSIQSSCVGSLYIALGVFLRKRDFLNRKPDWLLTLACVALFIVAGIYDFKISLASLLTGGNILVALVVDASGSVLCLIACQFLDSLREKGLEKIDSFFEYFGKGSLTVLCVHLLVIDLGFNSLTITVFGLHGIVQTIVLTVAHVLITGICIALFRKIPVLKQLWP